MIDLQDWFCENYLDDGRHDNLIYSDAAQEQIMFVRDKIHYLINGHQNIEFFHNHPVEVIGTHNSKSCLLPVYRIRVFWKDDDTQMPLEVIMRNNFYNWMVTVNATRPILIDHGNLFNPDNKISEVYCEGFKPEDVKGSYNSNKASFTVSIDSKYDLYTFFWLIVNNCRWMWI